jgi:beta-fructofuranosidase
VWSQDQPVPSAVVQSTRAFRERLLRDPFRPAFHFCVPEDRGSPGDPNGAFYHDGRYHLMYLYNRTGSGFSWGHVSSKDLLNWRHHPDAIGVGDGDAGCFSGGAFVDSDGKAVLSYWGLWGARGICLAQSTDKHFDHWVKFKSNPVIKSTEWGITAAKDKNGKESLYGSADPSNIWKKDGRYYMLTGNLLVLNKIGRKPDAPANEQGDRVYLFRSDDLEHWEYLHPFYESDRRWTDRSEDNMCPSFLPLPSRPEGGAPSGKYLMLFISHNKGCQYYVGRYEDDRFYPENHGRMTWRDNAYFAPESLMDGRGRHIMWSWVFDDRPNHIKNASGWTGTYGLPRSLWLGEDGTLRLRPVEELAGLRSNERSKMNFTVEAGKDVLLDGFGSELLELEIKTRLGEATRFGVKVCCSENGEEQTVLYCDTREKKLLVDTTKTSLGFGRKVVEGGPFELKRDEPLTLRVFVDKSIVEVYANDRQAVARRIYPTLGGRGVSLFAVGGDVKVPSVTAWEIMPSNPY